MRSSESNPISFARDRNTGLTSRRAVPSRTCLVKARLKAGSIPEDAPAMILIVPVGAIVVVVAFLTLRPSSSLLLPFQLGKTPLVLANSLDASLLTAWMNPITSPARWTASSELYAIPSCMRRSAHPISPRPTLRFPLCIASISGNGYLLALIILSRKWIAVWIDSLSPSQSSLGEPSTFVTNLPTFREPKLHASYGNSICSPQGLVASYTPTLGVGLKSLSRSMKIIPGSPVFHADSTMRSKTSRARSFPLICWVRGFISSYSPSCFRAAINASVTATEILKLVN